MERFGSIPQRLGKSQGANRHNHELLKIHAVVGVLAPVEDVHHGHRQPASSASAQIAVERKRRGSCGGPGNGHGHSQDRVGPELALVGRPVQFDHQAVDLALARGIKAHHARRDDLIDIRHRVANAFSAVALRIAVAELDRLVFTGRRSRWDRRGGGRPAVQGDKGPQRRVST